jgi:hypothetical protein
MAGKVSVELTPKEVKALRALVDYSYDAEERHYEETEPAERKGHIFNQVKTLGKLVKRIG